MPARISIAAKLFGGFALVLALAAALGLTAVSKIGAVTDKAEFLGTGAIPSIEATGTAATNIARYRAAQLRHVLEDDAEVKSETEAVIAKAHKKVDGALEDYADLVHDPEDRKFYEATKRDWAEYVEHTSNFVELSRGADHEAAEAHLLGENYAIYNKLMTEAVKWSELNEKFAAHALDEARGTAADARKITLVLLAVALLIGATVAFFVVRGIRSGVTAVLERISSLRDHDAAELDAGLGRFADGDLTYEVAPVTEPIEKISRDEIGDVASATNAIRDRLAGTIEGYNRSRAALAATLGQVTATAQTVSSASQQMASTSEESGRAVSEIASAVGEVAAGAERQVRSVTSAQERSSEVTHATGEGAEQARATAEAARRARELATEGSTAAEHATSAMSAVREASEEATAAIRDLGSKSSEIGGIVDTITGIAEQTNLLALNAAIEAARAGDQGRGFAVVAEEVRKLAEESQHAAASIADLVTEIQTETTRAVDVVELGSQRTAQGAATVDRARASFERIGGSVEDVTARVSEIAAAIEQIAAGATRLQDDIQAVAEVAEHSSASTEQVSATTQETSASTREIADSARELASTAAQLEQLIGRFTLA